MDTPPIFIAIFSKDESALFAALAAGADVNAPYAEETPLQAALRLDWPYGVRVLVEHGADGSVKNARGDSTPILACTYRALYTCESLREGGADFDAPNAIGAPPLHYACRLWMTVDPESRRFSDFISANWGPRRREEPIARSAGRDRALALLRELVETGATVDGLDAQGFTALQRAAAAGASDFVGTLINLGAKPNHRNADGLTALHVAAEKGHIGTMEILLEFDGEPGVTDACGATPLHDAASGGHREVVIQLLEAGAPLDAKMTAAFQDVQAGMTAEDVARLRGHPEVVALIKLAREREEQRRRDEAEEE